MLWKASRREVCIFRTLVARWTAHRSSFVVACITTATSPRLPAATAALQLRENPFDGSRKRVDAAGEKGVLSIRMFRIRFVIEASAHTITLESVDSGYTPGELVNQSDDPYEDKKLHARFVAEFP